MKMHLKTPMAPDPEPKTEMKEEPKTETAEEPKPE